MLNFTYYAPTQIVFGKGTEKQTGQLVKAQNCKKVLVHFGGKSAKESGLLDSVYDSLKENGIDFVSLGGVKPNPVLSLVEKGIELCKAEKVDFILAVGGGSVIDSAKAIGYGMTNDFPVWDIYSRKNAPKACLPIGAVLTIAAAGSEMSDSSVITNDKTLEKRGFSSNYCRLKFAIMNPELTFSLGQWQTQSGATDIIMHTLERWFTAKGQESSEMVDYIAAGLVKTVMHNAPVLLGNPRDYNARAEIMWASSLSHNGLTGPFGNGDWAVHQIEHELGGMFDVTHGAGLAAVWATWARYVYKENVERFVKMGTDIFDMKKPSKGDEEKTALEAIAKMEAFFKSVNMPISIKELGLDLSDAQCEQLAVNCTWQGTRTVGAVKKLGKAELTEIYKKAR
ncbi:iron-containing alcohol dehydrogenase [Treponema parvum]|uniref:Iron-containing alcohol dehydrogenase n=1 Tax=Treponema parvum TaxID=138851 RepID=A0A975F4J8_9SPIR|nr:iron-containing alcohol dehydrogenase [Treponema parvum]QTQ14332.1 iron-containing alcohol dehydrogenase [Treponema parvum]